MAHLRIALIIISSGLITASLAQESDAPSTNATTQVDMESASTNATDQTKAVRGLQITERTDGERITFLLSVAAVYFDNEDYKSAVDAYERVLAIDPENKEARFIVSHVYINAKQYAKAEVALKSLVEEFPEDFQLKNNLAWLYATAEDPNFRDGNKAIKLAQEAMVLAPRDHHVWSTLAEGYYVTGQYEKAYRAITHMASLATRYGKGITKEMVDEYNEQIRRCQRAWDSEKELNGEEETDAQSMTSAPAAE